MARLLHIGVGNFHRAHQAWYTAHAGGGWRITGVVMGNATLYDALRAGCGYTLGIRGNDGLATEVLDLHDRLILAARDPGAVVEAFADPDLHVVTLTITEKGYGLSPETGALDLSHPSIAADLSGTPSSAMGLLAHGLDRRAAAGLGPLTIISCDNISGNGRKLAAAMAEFAGAAGLRHDPANAYPDTMVDRITPATTEAIAAEIAEAHGGPVTSPVLTEAFSEWVIEDQFAGPHPDWATAGAQVVPDAAPYEMRKLRLLNSAHSYMAYAGLLRGHEFVHEAFADPELRAGVNRLWDEAQVSLPPDVLASTPAYRAALADRYAVAGMRHPLAQIGMDGSLKLRERWVPLVREGLAGPQTIKGFAAWIAFVRGACRTGHALNDPNAAEIAALVNAHEDAKPLSKALLGLLGLPEADAALVAEVAAEVTALSN